MKTIKTNLRRAMNPNNKEKENCMIHQNPTHEE
jgi:hypothetical protein